MDAEPLFAYPKLENPTTMKRTQEEKTQMIAALKHAKGRLPERSSFGNANHAVIDEQIAIIEGKETWDLTTEEAEIEFGDQGLAELNATHDWLNGATVSIVDEQDIVAVKS